MTLTMNHVCLCLDSRAGTRTDYSSSSTLAPPVTALPQDRTPSTRSNKHVSLNESLAVGSECPISFSTELALKRDHM